MRMRTLGLSGLLALTLPSVPQAATLNLADSPLFVTQAVAPLTMLVMGRDHKLFYEAYNDASDLDGDGVLDTKYKPDSIDYEGYFDSYKCYAYNGGQGRFDPVSTTANKKCSGFWSGDFLNYLTTSRMDAIRKVLYGGYRKTDTSSLTVLERAHITQDGHSWGKEYNSVAIDGYNISDYAPLGAPSSGKRHLFANTTLRNIGSGEPRLRVLANSSYRIWEWVSIEVPVAGNRVMNGGSGPTVTPTDYYVRVKVCDSSVGLESNCKLYPSGYYKPTGLLHDFGENDSMMFGLITGSFERNLSGGVLRRNITSFSSEINASTGQWNSGVNGIVSTIDKFYILNFSTGYAHNTNCGWIVNRTMNQGECRAWGNPIGEMMYETLRYFSGKTSPTSAFTFSSSSDESTLGISKESWTNPYSVYPSCAKPNMIVITDPSPSFDTDSIPGSHFSSFSGDLNINSSSILDTIWNQEMGGTQNVFIGSNSILDDRACTAKSVSSFSSIRGLCAEDPGKQGGYYSAAMAYHGYTEDLNSVSGIQNVKTYAVVMASPIPEITIPTANGTMKLIPFGKSIGPSSGCVGGINRNQGQFQPTNGIIDFYVESLTPTSGTFRVNFEDVEQGADHDMDAIVQYSYIVNPDQSVSVTTSTIYAAGCIEMHMGYIVSGTTADGPYLVVRDETSAGSDKDYFLDTPAGQGPGGLWNDGLPLPQTDTRTFYPSAGGSSATMLKDPLWYAAKWGGFKDSNGNNIPDIQSEWDTNGDGNPDNYFLVNNAGTLKTQLTASLNSIIERSSSVSTAALNSGSLNTDTRLYQAIFNTSTWEGQLLAFSLDTTTGDVQVGGPGPSGSLWDAGSVLSNQHHDTGRVIISYNPTSGKGVPFRWPGNPASPSSNEINAAAAAALNTSPQSASYDGLGALRLNYLRGDDSEEESNGGNFRDRATKLGDIINSNPLFVGTPAFYFADNWGSEPETGSPYSAFKSSQSNRTKMVYFGANDGMLHGVDAETGQERLAYVPSAVIQNLNKLTSPSYSHRYYVDGPPNYSDAFIGGQWRTVLVGGLNKGGQAVYALDITDPNNFLESQADTLSLWEWSDSNDADMGYSYSQPAIVRMANGKWAAVFGNGYNNTESDGAASTTGRAILFIVDLETGALIKKISTDVGTSSDPLALGRPNGLSTAAVVDINGDAIADYIYAGDLFGNLWKFDVSSSNPNQWAVALKTGSTPKPLFVAKDALGNRQPILDRPTVGRLAGSNSSLQVYFGTGKYLEPSDSTDTSIQTFYGITDDMSNAVSSRSVLLQQSILSETSGSDGNTYRITSNLQRNNSHMGWYIDFDYGTPVGERIVYNPILRNGSIIFVTLIPSSDPCEYGGSGWLMELNAQDGARLGFSPFDTNGDGHFGTGDYLGYGTGTAAPSGRKSTVGIIPNPGIISTQGKEYKYTPGTSGVIEKVTENPGNNQQGRQSWRQLK